MTGVTFQEKDTASEEDMPPVQCRRAILRRLSNVLTHARSELGGAQLQYESGFDRNMSFRPIGVKTEDFV